MADYIPNPNFYKDQIKEQEELRKKFQNASYDSDKRGYTVDGKFYTQAQLTAKINAIEPKISSIKKEEKIYGKYGPAYSAKAKPNAEGIQYEKLLNIAENIKVTDYRSSVDSLEAWKKVEDFISKNKDIRVVQRVDAIVDAGGGKRVRRAIPALIKVKPDSHGQAIANAESLADKYTTEDVVKTTRVQTYGEPGAANAAFTYKTEPIDEPVLTARQEEVAAIKNRQAVPPSVKSIARRQPSEKQVAGITPAVKTPKGSAGKTVEETPTISARQFEEQSMAAYKKIEEPASKKDGGGVGGGLGTGALKVKKKKEIDWESKFREMFPSQTWMLDIDRTKYADVFTLFKQSVKDEVYKTPEGLARFKTQLEGTSFVKELATTDMVRQVKSVVGDLGFDSMPFSSFLTKAMNLGWEGDTLKQEVYREAFRKDNAGNYVNPTAITRAKASNDYLSISKIGKSYFNTVSDDTVQNVLTGGMTPEDVQRQQRELAKTKYTHLGNLIDQGFSLEDLSSSFKTQAASILERDPNSIDMSQADFEQAFNFGEEGKKRIMTTGEWEIKLRSDPRYNWDKTNNAKQEARSLANSIASAFGKVI